MDVPRGNFLTRIAEMVRRAGKVFVSRQTPLYVKIILGAGLIYVLSPYDLIPEWIPVFGVLDDIALAALLISWAAGYPIGKEPKAGK